MAQSLTMRGKATIDGGEYASLKIDGMTRCTGDLHAKMIDVDGSLNCEGRVVADNLICDGVARFDSTVKVGRLDVDGTVTILGDKTEADELLCDGLLTIEGDLQADRIRADGAITAQNISGGQIAIGSFTNKVASYIKRRVSTADMINAAMISISGVRARQVNGTIIKIGPGCRIENLDCSDTLYIHKNATVQNITGDYKLYDWEE